jgi:hypothetical protein
MHQFLTLHYFENLPAYDRYTPEEMRSRGYLTFAVSNPLDGELVVEELAMLLTGGRLSSVSKTILAEIYTEEIIANGASAALKRVQKLFLTSPEFHSTNVYESTNAARLEAPRPQPSQRTYKAVVFLNLDGGFDSYNMLVPHSNCIGNTGESLILDISLAKSFNFALIDFSSFVLFYKQICTIIIKM